MSVGAWEHLCVDTFCISEFNNQTSSVLLLLPVLHVVSLTMSVLRCGPVSSTCIHGAWCLVCQYNILAAAARWCAGCDFLRLCQLFVFAMTHLPATFSTIYTYAALPSRHIRLLELTPLHGESSLPFEYRVVHVELPLDDTTSTVPAFEAVSYTWGHHAKVSTLRIQDAAGHIALTANLSEALPHVSEHCSTRRLWIDQLCINQADDIEKSHQVGLMAEIYKKAKNVIVWLGPEDESTTLCKDWLEALDLLLPTLPNADRTQHGQESFHDAYRFLSVRGTFRDSTWDSKYLAALTQIISRMYFRRSWIVQEFLLARKLTILAGRTRFTLENLWDVFCMPITKELRANVDNVSAFRTLIPLSRWPPTGKQPLRFLRIMSICAREFEATFHGDTLYSAIGMLESLNFRPDYEQSTKHNFTRFAATVAQDFGSLDFLGLCAAKLDTLIKDTTAEAQGFPSWVPSWTPLPLSTPWRLVAGGSHQWLHDVAWNASADRKHTCLQPGTASTYHLHVRGRIVDYIDTISSTIIGGRDWDVDTKFLETVVAQLQQDLPSCCASWTPLDLINFINEPSYGGNEVKEWDTAEAVLGSKPRYSTQEDCKYHSANDGLAVRLQVGRGRRFAVTERGRLCLVPFVDSQAKSETARGSPIVILHGCIVPLVLNCVNEERQEYWVVGEAYARGIMHGEAVTWDEDGADEFVLV